MVLNTIFPMYAFTRRLWYNGNGVVDNENDVFLYTGEDSDGRGGVQDKCNIQKLFACVMGSNNGSALARQIYHATHVASQSMRQVFGISHHYDIACAFISALTLLAHWTDPTCRTVIFTQRVLCAVEKEGSNLEKLLQEHHDFVQHHMFCSTCNNFVTSNKDIVDTCCHCQAKKRRKK
jgi:hypothetical protein